MPAPAVIRPSVATVGEAVTPWADASAVPLGELAARLGVNAVLRTRAIGQGLIEPAYRTGRGGNGGKVWVTKDDAMRFAAAALIAARKALPFLTVLALLVAVGAAYGRAGEFTIKIPD